MFECIIYDNLKRPLFEEWKKMWIRSEFANVFNSPEWYDIACRSFDYKYKKIIVLRCKETEKLLAVLPLVRVKIFGMQVFTLAGFEFIDRYRLLVDSNKLEIIDKLVSCITSLDKPVCIEGLVKTDVKYFELSSSVGVFFVDLNPYIKFKEEDKTFSLKKKNRKLKKAEKDFGSVAFSFVSSKLDLAMKEVFALDGGSSKTKKGKSSFLKKENRLFFEQLSREIPEYLFVVFLEFADKIVAYNVGFNCNGVYFCSQKAHLEEYSKYRPGGLIFSRFIEEIQRAKPKEIDMGRSADDFKMEYAHGVRNLYGLFITKNSFLHFYFCAIRNFRKKLYDLISKVPFLYICYKKIKNI